MVLAMLATLRGMGQAQEEDRGRLVAGVRSIAAPGLPGAVAVFSPQAGVVVAGKTESGAQVAVIATGHLGRGRVVAFGHDGYLTRDALSLENTGTLMANALRWAAGNRTRPRVGLVDRLNLRDLLEDKGFEVGQADPSGSLQNFDVLLLFSANVNPTAIRRIREWVRAGGGVVGGACGWGWRQLNHNRPMTEFPGNHLFAETGLAWTDGMAPATRPGGFTVEGDISPFANASSALRRIESGGSLKPADAATATENIRLALSSLTPEDRPLRDELLRKIRAVGRSGPIPSKAYPLRVEDVRRRLALGLETMIAIEATVDETRATTTSFAFPGAVPDTARHVRRTATVDVSVPGWHGLGLYAAPGDRIEVSVPSSAIAMNLAVRIGSHTDTLWHLPAWERPPEVVRRFPIRGTRTPAANAFGGTIYIDVPEGRPAQRVDVAVIGGVEAPRYVLGRTTRQEWAALRKLPVPWAELEGHRLIWTVPTQAIQKLDDPEPLLKLWDRLVEAQDRLVSLPRRDRPERIVADAQISAGYMHSGYPIMVPVDDSLALALSEKRLRQEGSWGHLHEIGHNHQAPDWTFAGTGEVTNNVLVVYCFDKVLGLPYDSGHPAIRDRLERKVRIRRHMTSRAPFAVWKDDPFLALMMYIQLYEGFGWEPFERVFAEYRRLPPDQRPRTDDEKRDQWLIRFSKAVGRDLGPFFQTWGVPTSESARASISGLPRWAPSAFEDLVGRPTSSANNRP